MTPRGEPQNAREYWRAYTLARGAYLGLSAMTPHMDSVGAYVEACDALENVLDLLSELAHADPNQPFVPGRRALEAMNPQGPAGSSR